MKILTAFCSALLLYTLAPAQCASWVNSPKKDLAEEAHVLYRAALKSKDYTTAMEHWKVAFEIAPAADGHRATHFTDGIELYKALYEAETNEAKKEEYKKTILQLYDAAVECMKNGSIVYKNCEDKVCRDQRIGWLLGNKAYDMFYTFYEPRAQTYEVLKESVKLTGTTAEYTVLYPFPLIVVYLFQTEQINRSEARYVYSQLHEIADYGIENHPSYGAYYQQAKDHINTSFEQIEAHIFDCDYFIAKLRPEYEADPTNVALLRTIIGTLKGRNCPEENPFLVKLEAEYAQYAAEYNAELEAEFERNNPHIIAKRAYDNKEYSKAVSKYKEAIEKESDNEKKASYYFSIASIQFRHLNQMQTARESAKTAAQLRSGWGRPYMLIGDMYAKSSSSCGRDAFTRGVVILAALDKWQYAKSIDRDVADEANKKIATYSQHMPPEEDAFMMGKTEGQSAEVGCWIGETVKLRFN